MKIALSTLLSLIVFTVAITFFVTKYYIKFENHANIETVVKSDTVAILKPVYKIKYIKTKSDTLLTYMQPKVFINTLISADSFKQCEEELIWQKVDKMPAFPGGEREMLKYLKNNIYYPESAYSAGVEGRVVISFIVDKEGNIESAKIIKDIGFNCGTVCKEIVEKMPRWSVPSNKGYPVKVQLFIPIDFSLK
jgi:TonB family protein